jgi:hypothetical protein
MLRLPFILNPYPDEILGSWIARIKLHNGAMAWRALLREARLETGRQFCTADIPNYSPSLGKLLVALGQKDYERLLLEHTTLPYWLSFDAATSDKGFLAGTLTLPLLLTKGRQVITNMGMVAIHHREKLRMRYCPTCLSSDYMDVGEPYWHRIHQLPNLTYCAKHRILLLSCCPCCGRTNLVDADNHITPPRMRCACGHDLCCGGTIVQPSRLQKHHTEIACDALSSGHPICNQSQIHAFLAARIAPEKLRRVIEKTCGNSVTGQAGLLEDDSADVMRNWRCSAGWLSNLRSPHVCALLAALGIDFQTAVQEASRLPAIHSEKGIAELVKTARAFMLKHRQLYPKRPSSNGADIHYWVLRLHDPAWLQRNYPKAKYPSFPSTQQDRASIRLALSGNFESRRARTYRWKCAYYSSAGCRARIRDRQWFDGQHAKFRRLIAQFAPLSRAKNCVDGIPRPSPVEMHLAALKDAFQAALLDKPRAGGLSTSELAQRAGLGPWTVEVLLGKNPPLRQEIKLARADLVRRRLTQAAEEFVTQGWPLRFNSLIAYAGCGHGKKALTITGELLKACRTQQSEGKSGSA